VRVNANRTMIKLAVNGGLTNYGLNVRSKRQKKVNIQSGPKKYIHSLLINIFGINLNEISISG